MSCRDGRDGRAGAPPQNYGEGYRIVYGFSGLPSCAGLPSGLAQHSHALVPGVGDEQLTIWP